MNPRRYFLLLALFALAWSGCAGTLGVWPHQALSPEERERVLPLMLPQHQSPLYFVG